MIADDPEVPFAFWLDPVGAVTVSYSLPVFHEIDFQVNEGYRRIPHGGVEVGGLLYGKVEPDSIRIEAFRPIDCEHASGPSFHLSERDLAKLSEDLQGAHREEELRDLVPIGWFIAHTRSALRLTEKELQLFDRFFPEAGRLTLLVKPERFKPTRFAFLLRDSSRKVNPDGERNAVILPLPGRPGKAPSPATAAIPAPAQPREVPRDSRPAEALPDNARTDNARAENVRIENVRTENVRLEAPGTRGRPDAERTLAEVPRPETKPPVPIPLEEPTSGRFAEDRADAPSTAPVFASDSSLLQASRPRGGSDDFSPRTRSRAGRFLWILVLAALAGCGAGYWAYLQLPAPYIALRAQKRSSDLLVLWNPAQTHSSPYAVIRINDSRPVLLTEEQKSSGVAQVPLSGDGVKVEIIAPHWARDSRGIIRFLAAEPSPPATQPGH